MDPGPPLILQCPHCKALYRREQWLSENTFGATCWSDGVTTDGMTGADPDPLVHCNDCHQFFAVRNAFIKNTWGYNLPKDKTFHRATPLALDDCLKILHDHALVTTLENGLPMVRLMIWKKLNDKIREEGYEALSPEERILMSENISELLPLIQISDDDLDETPLLWKAELHRNLGQFMKSIKVLQKIRQGSLQAAKNKMIFLNLIRNRKLVKLTTPSSRLASKIKLWWSWF